MIIVNFKIYKETFGNGAIRLAKICQEVSQKTGVKVMAAVGAWDIDRIKREADIEVLAQDVDEYQEGAWTGAMSIKALQAAGAAGGLINHSERRKKPGTIKKILAKKPEDFLTIVCLQSWGQTQTWAKKLKTNWVAYEPKYLIGNRDKSVSSEEPEMIKKMVEFYKPVEVIVGAGIHKSKDVRTAIKLGAKGVLVASDVVRAEDPKKELLELAKGF